MIRIIFFKRTLLFVLLVSSAVNPLLAIEESKSLIIVKAKKQTSQIFDNIKNLLQEKGLTEEASTNKVNKLFKNSENMNKLSHLYDNPYLAISKENLDNALIKYTLHEKCLDLNSYSSLISFVQNAVLQPLDKEQLAYISKLTSLS